jgi:hypothetical protein
VSTLEGLESLVEVGGDIIISASPISNLNELENLEIFDGNLSITNCSALNDISGLDNLTSLNFLTLQGLPNLTEINSFNNITNSVGNITINSEAQSINILNNVTSALNTTINSPNLSTLTMLDNATGLGNLTLENIPNGATIDAFNNISNSVLDVVLLNTNAQSIKILNNVLTARNFSAIDSNINDLTTLTNATTIENIYLKNVQTVFGFEAFTSTEKLTLNNVNTLNNNAFSQLNTVDELVISGNTPNDFSFINNLTEIATLIDIQNTSGIQSLNFDAVNSSNPLEVTITNNSSLQLVIGLNNTLELKSLLIEQTPN